MKDTLLIYCAEKLYVGVGEIVCTMEDWDLATFYQAPPNDVMEATLSVQYETKLCDQRLADGTDQPVMGQTWVIFDENLCDLEMDKYKQKVHKQEKQWNKCQEHKKLLMAIIWGQLDDDTQAKMELLANYQTHWTDGDIVKFLKSLCNIAHRSDDGGSSYHPFKAIVAMGSFNNFSSQDVTNVHLLKTEIKVEYKATKAICSKFPFGTEILVFIMVHFPGGAAGNTFATYCALPAADKIRLEKTHDELVLAMSFLNNSRNDDAKKDVRRAFANGNDNAYKTTL